jgi:hypothetical protein
VPYYNRDQHQRILDRFTSTISLINEYLPDDQKLATQVRDRRDADFVILTEDVVLLLEFVEKLVAAGAEPRGSVAAHNVVAAPAVPPDFDSDAYLFHNPDIAAARVDPVQHYLVHGAREGRRYRFF